jgi:hypothetical protein
MTDTPDIQQQQTQEPAGIPSGAAPILSGLSQASPDLHDAFSKLFVMDLAKKAQTSEIAQKAKAMDVQKAQAAQPVEDRPQPPPGSFADKLSSAVTGIGSDAAHASDTKGGWLSGVANALNARQQRLRQEQNDAMLHAKNQAETVAHNRNIWRQDEELRQKGLQENQDYFEVRKKNYDVTENVSHDEAMQLVKNPDWVANHYMKITGQVPMLDASGEVKKDKDGIPVMMPTYSYSSKTAKDGQDTPEKVTADESAAAGRLLGEKLPVGTLLTQDQHYAYTTKLNAARNALDKLEMVNGKKFDDDHLKSLVSGLNDKSVQAAVSEVPGSAAAGLLQHMDNADKHIAQYTQDAANAKAANNQQALDKANAQIAQYTEERTKLSNFLGVAVSKSDIADYQKKSDDAMSMVTDLQKKVDAAHGEEAAGIAASVKEMLSGQNNYTDQQKKMLTRIQTQAEASAKASLDYENTKEKNKAEATNALNDDDVNSLVDSALKYNLDPNKLYSMRKNTNAEFKARMIAESKRRGGPEWSEAVYRQRYNMQQDLAKDTPTSMGGQVDSLNRFSMHTGAANRSIEGLRNMGSPILNTAINKVKAGAVGFEEAQAFKVEAEAAKDEFLGFIKNGHVPPTEQEERLAAAVNMDHTPAELQSTFRAMAGLVAARAKSMNGRYNTIMGGGNIPGLLQEDSASILRQFGVDVDAITQTKGTSSFSKPINPSQGAIPPKTAKPGVAAGKAADGTLVWQTMDGSIQDAQGNKYNPQTGKRQ